ncbi:MAG: SRPBCC family protein [Acidobacteria bacterium]|nr:SRPBCC family protein [Acidobacteriota bacterium]
MAANENALNENTLMQPGGGDGAGEREDLTRRQNVNVGEVERWASAIGGGALALYGLTRGNFAGVALAIVGAGLLHRGTTGHCYAYDAMGVNTAGNESDNPNVSVKGGRGVKVEKSVTINREPAEIYNFWRNFENLPRFMNHLESVTVTGEGRSHWVAKAPGGGTVEWDAEVYNEKPNEMIAWRSLEGSQVDNAGSVHFTPAPSGGTEVRVVLKYDPPAGFLGALVARITGESPAQQIEQDLTRFKQLMETGGSATTSAATPPTGRAAKAQ